MATDICGVVLFSNPTIGISLKCRVCQPPWRRVGFPDEEAQLTELREHIGTKEHWVALASRAWALRMSTTIADAIERANPPRPVPSRQMSD